GRAAGHAHRLRQDVPGGGPQPGPGRRGHPGLPVGLADQLDQPGAAAGSGPAGLAVRPVRLRPGRGEPGGAGLGQPDRGHGRHAVPRPGQGGRAGRLDPGPHLGPGRAGRGRTGRGRADRHRPPGAAAPGRAPARRLSGQHRNRGASGAGPADATRHPVRPGGAMKIALLTYSTKPRGGVVHTLALAEALAAAGQEVTVWTLGRGGDGGFFRPVDPAVGQVVVPFPDRDGEQVGARILRSIATLRAAFDPADYDVVHAQDCISANAVGRCLRTVHHIDHFSTPELVACHERAIREPYGHICVSGSVARELRDGWGIGATVIPNGVDAGRFAAAAGPSPAATAARAAWRQRLGRYVLAVGGIEPRKGSIDLLDSFALLRETRARRPGPDGHPGRDELRLVIAGGETLFDYRRYRAAWQARADELGLAPVGLEIG